MSKFDFNVSATVQLPKVKMKGANERNKSMAKTAFKRGVAAGIELVRIDLKKALDINMHRIVWNWPNDTLRRNGKKATEIRNIVDTGALKGSLVMTSKAHARGGLIKITYNSPYANIVHWGGAMQPYGNRFAGTKILPARPWVLATLNGSRSLKKFDIGRRMQKTISAEFRGMGF